MLILIAILCHDAHGIVRMRVTNESDAHKYLNNGWRLIGFETWKPQRRN